MRDSRASARGVFSVRRVYGMIKNRVGAVEDLFKADEGDRKLIETYFRNGDYGNGQQAIGVFRSGHQWKGCLKLYLEGLLACRQCVQHCILEYILLTT